MFSRCIQIFNFLFLSHFILNYIFIFKERSISFRIFYLLILNKVSLLPIHNPSTHYFILVQYFFLLFFDFLAKL